MEMILHRSRRASVAPLKAELLVRERIQLPGSARVLTLSREAYSAAISERPSDEEIAAAVEDDENSESV
jgi:hypothetical protein